MLKYIGAGILGLAILIFAFVMLSGASPQVSLNAPVVAIGSNTPVSVRVKDPHGIRSFAVAVEQGGQTERVFVDAAKSREPEKLFSFNVGKKNVSFLKEGPAKLLFTAKSNDMRGAESTLTQDVNVVLKPPTVVPDGRQHYINQGGSELVTFEVGGNWTAAGVKIGKYTTSSFSMPGQPDNSTHRFALFPYPWDLTPDTIPQVYVSNAAGTEVTTSFESKIFPKKFRESNIPVTDAQMQKVVGELDPDGSGSLLDRFLHLNRDVRKQNSEFIFNLRNNTEQKMLWSGPFVPIKGTRESYFADTRHYFYQGKLVDTEVHLGFDLAQQRNMPVTAANSGKVIYADRLGIYGNCIILDHGYTLQTLYGHLSRIDVKVGEMVQKGQKMGISGATGMAFGDHVHFSMMVAGVQINPIEWWDEHWIKDHIYSQIGAASK